MKGTDKQKMEDNSRKFKYLIKNLNVFAIGLFFSKISAFILVAFYTRVLANEEYGIYELLNSTLEWVIPLITLNMHEAVLRFMLSDEKNNKEVVGFGIRIIGIGLVILSAILSINHIFGLVTFLDLYAVYFILMYIVKSFHCLFERMARGMNEIKCIMASSILCCAVLLLFNFYFLSVLKIGIQGCLASFIVSEFITDIYFIFKLKFLNNASIITIPNRLKKQMLSFSLPLVINSISWWIIELSDRYMVTYFCGIEANGIYSAAYKIPKILNLIQNVFAQAWVLSAVQAYKTEDGDKFISYVYKIYNLLMTVSGSVIIIFTKMFAKVLYSDKFYIAWQYSPILTISIVFNGLCILLAGIFTAARDTRTAGLTTLVGAFINIFLNYFLINAFGPMGAAVSTLISIVIVWGSRILVIRKHIVLHITLNKDNICYVLLIIQSLSMIWAKGLISYIINLVCLISILYLNRELEIRVFYSLIKKEEIIKK